MQSCRNDADFRSVVYQCDIALDLRTGFKVDFAIHFQGPAAQQPRHTQSLKGIDHLILIREGDQRRLPRTGWMETDLAVLKNLIGIGTKGEQITCGFDRCKATPRHVDGERSIEALDGSAHGDLQLIHRR